MGGPLEGIRVIDVTEGAQGPWAGALLADLGADVIKVERPQGEMMRQGGPRKNGFPLPHVGMNHGKRNIVFDVKTPEGMETMLDLVRGADIFMENWRRDVSARLGLDFESLRKINPDIVYGSASGFGEAGRYGPLASTDGYSQAMEGYYSLNGPIGGPGERPRFIVIDFTSPLTLVQALIMGLMERDRTGEAQWVHCSQLRTLHSLAAVRSEEYFASGEVPQPMGSTTAYCVPSQAFKTADAYVAVECPSDESWRAFCNTILLPKLADDERFATNAKRVENRAVLTPILEKAMLRFEAHRWIAKFREAGVPCSRVNMDIEDLYE
ncbi:MAG: CaiB/BaiF CoA-transferase family protein, partial [Chloroflexota bacterium]